MTDGSIRTVRPASTAVQVRQRAQPVPIFVSWTSGVVEEEGQAAVQGVRDVLEAAGQTREVRVFGSRQWSQGDYGCADWYQEQTMFHPVRERHGYGPQTNASHIIGLMSREPWQKKQPHLDVMLVDRDTSTGEENMNFVFGVTWPGFGFVQSVARIREAGRDLNLRLLQRVSRHEFGHVLGLPSRGYQVEQNLGLHCTNVCCMRQGLHLQAWVAQLNEEERSGVMFCSPCLTELRNLPSR